MEKPEGKPTLITISRKSFFQVLVLLAVLLAVSIALPLDLHVLGLSLAFILSQDQTLRCKRNYMIAQNNRIYQV